jgi:hypothetical protein
LIEESLARCRDEYSELLKADGEPMRAIFGNCQFLPRATAEAWIAEAREEGRQEGLRTARAEVDPTPYPDEDTGDENDQGDDEPVDDKKDKSKKKKTKKAAEPEDTCDEQDEQLRRASRYASDDVVVRAEIRAGLPVTAAQILYCGRIRRGEVPSLPPRGSPARQIIDAGRRARGLKPLEG